MNSNFARATFAKLILPTFSFAQGGLYGICEPNRPSPRHYNVDPLREVFYKPIEEVLGKVVPEVQVSRCSDLENWISCSKAEQEFAAVLHSKTIKVTDMLVWGMDVPVTLQGKLRFAKDNLKPFAVSSRKVCFQDANGNPWYFMIPDGTSPTPANKASDRTGNQSDNLD